MRNYRFRIPILKHKHGGSIGLSSSGNYFSWWRSWGTVMAAILKVWRHIKNRCCMPYSLEEQSCQISSQADLKRRPFLKRSPQQQQQQPHEWLYGISSWSKNSYRYRRKDADTVPLIGHSESFHDFHLILFVIRRTAAIKKVVQMLFTTTVNNKILFSLFYNFSLHMTANKTAFMTAHYFKL